MSPWCLSTFTSKGEPTESAKRYWKTYNAIPRKIAFENGKPVAFSSSLHSLPKDAKLTFRGVKVHKEGASAAFVDVTELEMRTWQSWIKEGLAKESRIRPDIVVLTPKGEAELQGIQRKEEAWWDMEDTHEQSSLSDSIVGGELSRVEIEQEYLDMIDQLIYDGVPLDPNDFLDEELPFFTTPQGEVYGFVDKDGNIYLDETKISPEHPIHEYTHLWDRTVQKKNPKLWQRGVELMKQTSLWNEINNDANYGKLWQSIPQFGITFSFEKCHYVIK